MAEPSERDREMADYCQAMCTEKSDETAIGIIAHAIAAARAEGEAEARAELAAANSLNHEAEIAAILDGMEPHAKDLLSEQMRGLCANIAEVCETECRRKAVEAAAAIVRRHPSDHPQCEDFRGCCELMEEQIAALAEPPTETPNQG